MTLIATSVVANAAAFKWTGANIYDSSGSSKLTGTVAVYAYATTATINDAVKVADAYVVAGTIKSDAVGTANGYSADWADAVAGTTYNFYLLIEDGDKTLNTATIASPVVKSGVASETGATPIAFGTLASATQASGNWAAVPEPTSGLLMLLGMAGLVLRRRRA